MRFTTEEAARFWAKVNYRGPLLLPDLGCCWVWLGSIDKDGYGRWSFAVSKHGRYQHKPHYRTHRVSFFLTNGMCPDDVLVCYQCDNRSCVRPSHLFLGTALDNALDMHQKKRAVDNSGERHGMHKLSEEKVLTILNLLNAGTETQQSIAARYLVDRSTISNIKCGKYWRHVCRTNL